MKEEIIDLGTVYIEDKKLNVKLYYNDFKTNSFSSVYLRASNRNMSITLDEEEFNITGITPEMEEVAKIGDLDAYGTTCYLDNILYYSSPTTTKVVKEKVDIILVDNLGNKVPMFKGINNTRLENLIILDSKEEINLKDYTEIVKVPKKNQPIDYTYSANYTLKGIESYLKTPLNSDPWYNALFNSLEEAEEFVSMLQEDKFHFKIVITPEHTIEEVNKSYDLDTAVNILHNYSGKLDKFRLPDKTYLMEVCKDIMYNTTLPFIKKWFSDEAYQISLSKADKIYKKED